MIYGYGRVSSRDQNLETQIDQLEKYGCDEIITEKITGIAEDKKLNELLPKLKEGDKLVCCRMDRLGRSTKQLLALVDELKERGVGLVLLDVHVDTNTPAGKMFLTIMAAFSEMEREQLKEKQARGIANRRRKGLDMGRKPQFKKAQMEEAVRQVQETNKTIKEICEAIGVSRATLYRELKARNITR